MASKNPSSTYFVTYTNPEIYHAPPRAGGRVKIDIPPRISTLKASLERSRQAKIIVPKLTTSRSRSRLKIKSAKELAAASAADKESPSKKSLLTVTTTFKPAKDVDIDSCPKEFKVKQLITATPWSIEFDDYLESTGETNRVPDPFQDSVDMLAMTISVIMLLSRGYSEISTSHFRWVYSYLDCIRDEFGNIPPNCQGILNHIRQQTGGKIKSFLDEDEDEELVLEKPSTVQISEKPPQTVG